MTGNNKVWRAPLAGLAAAAMLATMGVAAGTANAATTPANVTFSIGGTSFEFGEEDLQTPATAVDGRIDATELKQAITGLDTKFNFNQTDGSVTVKGVSYTLTGFKDGSALQAVLTNHGADYGNFLVNPDASLSGEVTLTARLSRDPYTVKFVTKQDGTGVNVVKGGVAGNGSTGEGEIKLAMTGDTLDLVPSWAVPTTEVSATDHLVAYKKDGKTLADDAYWKTTGTKATVKDPTASSLYTDAFAVLSDGSVDHNAVLTLHAAAATLFKFETTNAVRNDATNFTALYDNSKNSLSTPFNGEAATGEMISDYLDFPTAVNAAGQSSREWYAAQADTKAELDPAQKWDDSQKAGTDVTLYAANATNSKEITLHYNATGVKDKVVFAGKDYAPETPANVTVTSVEYKFAGWYTDSALSNKFVGSALGNITDLYAKWDIAAVRFWVDPNYNTETPKAVWVNNGANFRVPVAGDYRSGWNATVSPVIYAAGVDADGDGRADAQDNFNLYPVFDSNLGIANGSNVALKYQDKDGQHQLKYGTLTGWSDLVPGVTFKFENWSKATVQDLNTKLDQLKADVIVKKDGQYIKGADQDDFTAASFDQYVSDLQEFEKNNGKPSSVADYQSQIDELAKIQAKLVEVSDTYVYRAYNKYNGDHYFTSFKSLYDNLVKIGWNAEGSPYKAVAGTTLDGAPTENAVTEKNGAYYRKDGNRIFGQAIYSVYNRYTGEHLLTASKTEADSLPNGWENEGVSFFAPQGATEDVYRSYNPYTRGPAHVYVSLKEYNDIAKAGWKGEDIVFKLDTGK